MITPAEIQRKAKRQYSTFLSAVLTRERFFPLNIKGNKGKASDEYEKLFREIKRLLESEKQQLGYGYTVTLKTVNTRHAGQISMPDAIFFENVEDYVKYIGKEEEFLAFRKAVQFTHKHLPGLKIWMADQPLKVIKHLNQWENIVKTISYFLEHPLPKVYARQIPNIPATFIENYKNILTEILNSLLLKEAIQEEETHFARRFGLKYDEPIIHIRSLDGNLENLPLSNLALPIGEFQNLAIAPEKVFVISDKINFLRFPNCQNAIAIWGETEILPFLKVFSFVQKTEMYFWGDISILGFEQLSMLRQGFPNIQSLLMDIQTLESYENHIGNVKLTGKRILTRLTKAEIEVLETIQKGKQLLQKHILQSDIEKVLNL